MDINTSAFIFSIIISAVSAIVSDDRGQKFLSCFLRPFTISLIIGLLLETRPSSSYRNVIVIALIFSLLGEVMMMMNKKRFLAGLLFFLAAQVSLAVAFYSKLSPGFLTWPVIPLILVSAILLFLIRPGLGKLRLPVLFYFLAILTMIRLAIEFPHQIAGYKPWLVASGAFLFFVSDALLALNRFRRPFPGAQIYILSTFYLSLLLIALSV
jgi:uncharacterized membrane protein YhhN